MTKTLEEQLATIEGRIDKRSQDMEKLKKEKKEIKKRISERDRKARTRRLIEKGAVAEQFFGENVTPEELLNTLKSAADVVDCDDLTLRMGQAVAAVINSDMGRQMCESDINATYHFLRGQNQSGHWYSRALTQEEQK